jgi:hypothetical protein
VPVLSKEWFAQLDAQGRMIDKFLRLSRHYHALRAAEKVLRGRVAPSKPGIVRKVHIQQW